MVWFWKSNQKWTYDDNDDDDNDGNDYYYVFKSGNISLCKWSACFTVRPGSNVTHHHTVCSSAKLIKFGRSLRSESTVKLESYIQLVLLHHLPSKITRWIEMWNFFALPNLMHALLWCMFFYGEWNMTDSMLNALGRIKFDV